jgi:PhnB protein
MTFYQQVFGGELAISTFGDYGSADENTDPNGVMHALLETPLGFTLMASDAPSHMDLTVGTNITLSISGTDGDELRSYFAQLMEGGREQMPLQKQVWGDEFGMGTDKFGIAWMVNITPGT